MGSRLVAGHGRCEGTATDARDAATNEPNRRRGLVEMARAEHDGREERGEDARTHENRTY